MEDTNMDKKLSRNTTATVAALTVAICCLALTTCMYAIGAEQRAAWSDASAAWIAERADSICGLDDLRQVSNPARIDYGAVMKATPEIKKMHDEHIDANSPEGIQLRALAADRVKRAAEIVRTKGGYCSVWKHIQHKDGREVPDVSSQVIAQL
jgi:hypothetical protein